MADEFKLIMISAVYENGGNTTHRMLDGHPELFAYPFESQLGTSLVNDYLTSYVPFRYRWPEFALTGTIEQDYELFYDEEMKTMLRVPERSKFRHADMKINEADRKEKYFAHMKGKPRTRATAVEAFFRSTFDAWTNVQRTGKEKAYLGYSPVLCLDSEKIMADFPNGHIIHVVRNPYSGFADTSSARSRPASSRHTWTWNYCQLMALTYAERFPNNFHIVRFEDLVADRKATMSKLCTKLGLSWSDTCLYPSWNGVELKEVYPWGTVRTATPAANLATANLLTDAQKAEIKSLSIVTQRALGYENFWVAGSTASSVSKAA